MLETERLILRKFETSDADAVFRLRSDADVMRFIREPQNRDETKKWIELVSKYWASDRIGFCAVVDKQTEKLCGWCGLWRLKETGETEVGYAVDKEFWGRGLATEAARKLLEYGFEVLNLGEIVAVARPDNRGSRRVMEKLGMSYDYTGEFYGRPLVHYSIARAEFIRSSQV